MRTVENLLLEHGNTAKGRKAARAELAETRVENARRQAVLDGLSMNCESDTLHGTPLDRHRCRNDGSTCLCACHDPEAKP